MPHSGKSAARHGFQQSNVVLLRILQKIGIVRAFFAKKHAAVYIKSAISAKRLAAVPAHGNIGHKSRIKTAAQLKNRLHRFGRNQRFVFKRQQMQTIKYQPQKLGRRLVLWSNVHTYLTKIRAERQQRKILSQFPKHLFGVCVVNSVCIIAAFVDVQPRV